MINAFINVAVITAMAIAWSGLNIHDYHTDLKNIAYQLSRIADALNRRVKDEQT